MNEGLVTPEEAQAEVRRLREVLERQQIYAWDSLRQAVITIDEQPALRPATGGRALRTLLDLLANSAPIGIERIDVEVLASGLYEAVMDRAGLTPDPRVHDQGFRVRASREFDLEPAQTLWDDPPILNADVLDAIRDFSDDQLRFVGPNLTHA